MTARVTLLHVAAAEASTMTGFGYVVVEGDATPIAKGLSEEKQGDLLRGHLQAFVHGLQFLTTQKPSGGRDSVLLVAHHEFLTKGVEEWMPRWNALGRRRARWLIVDGHMVPYGRCETAPRLGASLGSWRLQPLPAPSASRTRLAPPAKGDGAAFERMARPYWALGRNRARHGGRGRLGLVEGPGCSQDLLANEGSARPVKAAAVAASIFDPPFG
jgi:hypothetical protein